MCSLENRAARRIAIVAPRAGRRHRARGAALVALTGLVAACGGGGPSTSGPTSGRSATGPGSTSTSPASSPTPAGMAAPIIVQVENAPDARPQGGLQSAGIVYEYATEGGITRFSAIFFTPPPGRVGPVRSARLVTTVLVPLYQALLIYSGASTVVSNRLAELKIPRYSEGSFGHVFRVGDRAAPHNLFTDGPGMSDLARRANLPPVTYRLWPRTTSGPGGVPAGTVHVPLSGFEVPVFTWNAQLSGYTRTEPTGQLTDADTRSPLVTPTVVVLQVPVQNAGYVEDVNGAPGLEYTLTGYGPAQVFTGATEFNATWTQPGGGPPQLTLPGGGPAPIAPGLVWICLVPQGTSATFTP